MARAGLILLATILAAGCGKQEQKTVTDILTFLDATVVNYHSQTFTLSDALPLGVNLPNGTGTSYTARIAPVEVKISGGGYQSLHLEKAAVLFRMTLQGQNFSGTTNLRLLIGNQLDIYNDPNAVILTQKQILPATFELDSSDPRLNTIFSLESVVFGIEFISEPTLLNSHQISILGHIEKFDVEITGAQNIF
ncbi:MAG: hypothetical protein A3F83_03120 [Candidatus Glassbacteria bacterium RIFCSPLOWO2_12_FULL_58_11]|uniref:Uncharacterized protein n=1 Tax=Candidatus Glassbacteria bacterium RIFCSPLOWO2_12_FULL_58_11 TaxID=1817867 RepID=A0A1F5YWY3_9BACT|nr:MAG: hypothetical protein A3F83_03120 [Candidatus Glassbacteria bacterium RIFCSPLOWO2_12_FULL_58_11]